MESPDHRTLPSLVGLRDSLPSSLAVGTTLLGMAVVGFWSRSREESISPFLNIEIIRETGSPDALPRITYYAVMATLIVVVAVLNRGRWRAPSSTVAPVGIASLLAVAMLSVGRMSAGSVALGLLLAMASIWILGSDMRRRDIAMLVFGALMLGWFLSAIILPGLDPVIVVEKASLFVVFQEHYGGTVMSGLDAFSSGSVYYPVGYGHLGAVVGALGLLLGDGSLVQLVWLGHLLFFILLCWGLLLLIPFRRGLMILLLVALAVPENLLAAGPGMYTPNLSGVRYLATMLGILLLIRFARRGEGRWTTLGAALGALAALTIDGGILLLAIMSVMAALVHEHEGEGVVKMMRRLVVSILSFLVSGLLVGLGLSQVLSSGAISVLQVLDFAGGRGGHVAPLDPTAAVFFVAAAAILVLAASLCRSGGRLLPLAAGLAFASLVQWFTFLNRMFPSQLRFGVVLVGLSIAALLGASRTDSRSRATPGEPSRIATLIGLAALVVSASQSSVPLGRPDPCQGERGLASGYCLEGDWVLDLSAMVDFLEGQPAESRAVLSSAPVLVRELGFNANLPYSRGVFANEKWEQLAGSSIAAPWIQSVLVQSPDSLLGAENPVATRAFEDIVASSGVFEYSHSVAGWSVFLRRGSVLPIPQSG